MSDAGSASELSVCIVSPYHPRGDGDDVKNAYVGGVEMALDQVSRALARRGLDVTLLSTHSAPGEAVVDGVRHVRVRRLATLFRTPLSTAPLRVPGDADVVQVPATYPTYSDAALLLARLRGTPTVLDYHFDVHPTSRAMAAATGLYYRTLGRAMAAADRVVVHAPTYAESSRGLDAVDPARVVHVPNGVDVDRFRPVGGTGDHVLCVGRLVPYKGVDVLVRAMAQVQEHVDAPLKVAGEGHERPRLERLAKALDVDAEFMGFVPDGALPPLYASARLTVLPSRNGQEAFGLTLLESMASGTPVVASDLPGVREVAAMGGVTARPADADHLAQRILDVLEGRAPVPDGGEMRRRVAKRYAWDAVADQYVDLYRRLAGGS